MDDPHDAKESRMSVVLDRPIERTQLRQAEVPVALQPRPRPTPAPEQLPRIERPVERSVDVPGKVQRRTKVKVNVGQIALAKMLMFCGVAAVAYVGSDLCGHYMVEKSRNETIAATNRATSALRAEREVQRRLDGLTSAASIEDWALSHGFRPTDGLGQTSKVVNLVATAR